MKRFTADDVVIELQRSRDNCGCSEYYQGVALGFLEALKIVRENLVPQWQDEPDEDTHARCPWWWCEDCGPESPPQLLRCYRPLKATPHGNLTVDMQAPKEWTRWTVSGWVPLVGRVCPIGVRPST